MKKKNILLILADQLRADFCGCYGADWVKTPNIDQLAKEGVLYKTAVTPSPACVPARASLLTGVSAVENRVLDNAKWLRPDHEKMGIYTWPQVLAKEGYHTAAIGKMHFYPWDISEGFQHRVIAEDKRHIDIQDDYTLYLKKHGYNRVHGSAFEGFYDNMGAYISTLPDEYQIDRYVSNETCNYIRVMDRDRPFAMMVGFPGPHCPYDPTENMLDGVPDGPMPPSYPVTEDSKRFLERNHRENRLPWNGVDLAGLTDAKTEKLRRHYCGLVQGIDEFVGRIIETLKEEGFYEDTIILFTSDHGDYLGDFNMLGKGHYYESATKIPMIVRHPEQNPEQVNHAVSLTDIHHTILEFAGQNPVDSDDSTVLAPFGSSSERSYIFGSNDMGWMIHSTRYVHTMYYNGVREFYDLEKDHGQQHNLILDPKYRDLVEEYRDVLSMRVFRAMNEGNIDNTGKFNNMTSASGPDWFNYEGWQRPYPYWRGIQS